MGLLCIEIQQRDREWRACSHATQDRAQGCVIVPSSPKEAPHPPTQFRSRSVPMRSGVREQGAMAAAIEFSIRERLEFPQ
jgi:hypothetical protein